MSVPLPPITEDQETSTSTPPSLHHSTLEPLQLPLPLSQGREAFEEAKALYESGLYIARDNPQAAIAHFLQAASVFSELKGQKKKREKCYWQAGISFGRVGWNAKKRRDWNEAKTAFEEALSSFRMIGDTEKEATTLYQLSLVSFDLLSASDYLKKAALVYTELGNDEKEAMCLAELGNLFGGRRNQRDVESSLFHWRQALLLYMKKGDQEKEARALYSIGEVLLHTDKQAAYNHFLQARVVFRRLGNQPKQDGNCSYQLGKICTGQKSFQAAVQFFEESSTLFRQIEAKTDEAWSLYRLALVMLKVDSNELAVDYLTEARRLFAEAGHERQAEGSCLMRMGEVLKESNPPLAKTLLEEALEYVDPVKERVGRRSTLVLESLQSSSAFKRSTRRAPMRDISEEEEEVNGEAEQWSFAGATEEGGAREIEEERVGRVREGSEGAEGAWWAIASARFFASSLLFAASADFPSTQYLDYALAVEEVTSAKKDTLILNVDGAIAVSFCDLLKSSGAFTPEEAAEYMKIGTLNGLFVLGRSIGFIGSLYRTRSTKSNRIKQEQEGDVSASLAPPTPQPRTSFLDLPDEVISLVLEGAHEPLSTSAFATIPPQSVTFLINKRIFELARPVWSKTLSIQGSQLDIRLAGIHTHEKRRDLLRMLDVPLTNLFYNLLNSVFLRLPLLSHLTLHIPENTNASSIETIAGGLINLVSLKNLRLQAPRLLDPLYNFFHRYLNHNPISIPCVSFQIYETTCIYIAIEEGWGAKSYRWALDLPMNFFEFDWSNLRSLELRAWDGCLPFSNKILGGLRMALTGNAQSTSLIVRKIPLRRLTLDLRLSSSPASSTYKFFSPTDCAKLFELLAFTELTQLELSALESIPNPPARFKLRELKILKLSGTCSFRETNNFQALLSFLNALPSLKHLHLVGWSFFGVSSTANEMSKLEKMPLYFRFPELGILLVYLRQSSVITFTYRGEGEQRELRWTRMNANEEFDQDCWTEL